VVCNKTKELHSFEGVGNGEHRDLYHSKRSSWRSIAPGNRPNGSSARRMCPALLCSPSNSQGQCNTVHLHHYFSCGLVLCFERFKFQDRNSNFSSPYSARRGSTVSAHGHLDRKKELSSNFAADNGTGVLGRAEIGNVLGAPATEFLILC